MAILEDLLELLSPSGTLEDVLGSELGSKFTETGRRALLEEDSLANRASRAIPGVGPAIRSLQRFIGEPDADTQTTESPLFDASIRERLTAAGLAEDALNSIARLGPDDVVTGGAFSKMGPSESIKRANAEGKREADHLAAVRRLRDQADVARRRGDTEASQSLFQTAAGLQAESPDLSADDVAREDLLIKSLTQLGQSDADINQASRKAVLSTLAQALGVDVTELLSLFSGAAPSSAIEG